MRSPVAQHWMKALKIHQGKRRCLEAVEEYGDQGQHLYFLGGLLNNSVQVLYNILFNKRERIGGNILHRKDKYTHKCV